MRPDSVGLGGFDSHAFPPRVRRAASRTCLLLGGVLVPLMAMFAQDAPKPAVAAAVVAPITPARAFIASSLFPGLGQAQLGMPKSGLFFSAIEVLSIAMWQKSKHELALARAMSADSTPLAYVIDPVTGLPARDPKTNALQVSAWSQTGFGSDRVHARSVHVEDWAAIIVFNHLFAGIDAFVAAQLWELPARVALQRTPTGTNIGVTIRW